jgi:hypothetical protein
MMELITYRGLTPTQLDEVIDYYRMQMGRLPKGKRTAGVKVQQIVLDEAKEAKAHMYYDKPRESR